MPAVAVQPATLRERVQSVSRQLEGGAHAVTDMSRAGSLELDPTMQGQSKSADRPPGEIRRLEGAIRSRMVHRHQDASPIRYFLDGSQKTLPVWRAGTMPVVAAITAVAILERKAPEDVGLVPDTIVDQVTWILPLHTSNPALNRIADLLIGMGETVIDPLASVHDRDPADYHTQVGYYTYLLERSYEAAKSHREGVEQQLLRYWAERVLPGDRDGWIVADGRLRSEVRNAIGLVKDVQAQHLIGEEAIALYDLPIAHRTTAYSLADDSSSQRWERTMWYLRMQNATGKDARHGLIRLETSEVVDDLDVIDRISSWILTERAPRASSDARWPTLLYPIHLLERMLKRRIQAITAGWPA